MIIFEAVRVLIMFALSFLVALFLTPIALYFLEKFDIRKKNIRDAGSAPVFHQLHKGKSGTVTMAGVIVWVTVLGIALFFFAFKGFLNGFAEYFNFVDRAETYLPLAALFLAALLGMADDLLGVFGIGKKGGGLSVFHRILLYSFVALLGAFWFYYRLGWDVFSVPFFGTFSLGPWYILVFVFILVATAFSANETDGLDGLAAGTLFFAFGAMVIVSFILLLESFSVIVQVVSKKIRGKRVFRSAPIHHHFEAIGWHESQVTMRFWIVY